MGRKNKLKRIAIINQDSGYLMIDIANEYRKKGYETTLVAGRIVERDVALDKGIKVRKIMQYNRSSTIKRLISWLVGTLQILLLIWFKFRNIHLLIVSNPPLAPLLSLLTNNRYSLLIFDVYPDALADYGFVKRDSLIVRWWAKANEKAYAHAFRVYTLTQGMRKALEKYVEPHKIDLVPLWTNNEFLKPVGKENNLFVKKYKLEGKFIVLYSGNFGYSHQVDLLVELASKTQKEDIMFVLIGGGAMETEIKQKVKSKHIDNCLILPWQEVDVLPYSLASADLSVVTLNEKAALVAIPSKIFNYMSVGSPVLGITASGSDLEKLIVNYKIGKSFQPCQLDEILQFIEGLSANRTMASEYSRKSLQASEFHTSKNTELITQYDV